MSQTNEANVVFYIDMYVAGTKIGEHYFRQL